MASRRIFMRVALNNSTEIAIVMLFTSGMISAENGKIVTLKQEGPSPKCAAPGS